MSWTKQDAKKLSEKILSFSKARECEVALTETSLTHTRFAANEITTSGAARDLSISITSRGEGKSGTVRANDLDPEALRKAVALSEELMRSATPDPEFVEGLGPQAYPEIHSFHAETARAGALEHRPGVKAALDEARRSELTASGFSEAAVTTSAIANKKGNFGFHVGSTASYSTTMRTADGTGSGWAGFESPRFGDLKAANLAARAATKAQASASPKELPPGVYTVILEPRAVADLLGQPLLLAVAALRRRGAELPVQAGRRQPHRRGGLRADRHSALGPVRPAALGAAVVGRRRPGWRRRRGFPRIWRLRRRCGPAGSPDGVGRKGRREGGPDRPLLGREEQSRGAPLLGQRDSRGRLGHRRRARRREPTAGFS